MVIPLLFAIFADFFFTMDSPKKVLQFFEHINVLVFYIVDLRDGELLLSFGTLHHTFDHSIFNEKPILRRTLRIALTFKILLLRIAFVGFPSKLTLSRVSIMTKRPPLKFVVFLNSVIKVFYFNFWLIYRLPQGTVVLVLQIVCF